MSINFCSNALFLGDPHNTMHLKASVILSYQSAQKKEAKCGFVSVFSRWNKRKGSIESWGLVTMYALKVRAGFNWTTKVTPDCFSSGNSCRFLNELNIKLIPMPLAFSRASSKLPIFYFEVPLDNYDVNALTPMSNWDRISPYNINAISTRQVMRIKKTINFGTISRSNTKFSDLTL